MIRIEINKGNYLSMRMWLFAADLNEPRSQHFLMPGGRSLNNLAPKFAIENVKLSFDSLRPSFLLSLVSLVSFSGMRLWSMIGTRLFISLKKLKVKIAITASDDVDVVLKPSHVL